MLLRRPIDPERINHVSGELNQLHWLTLEQARDLDLPAVTRWAIDIVEKRLELAPSEQLKQSAPFVRFAGKQAISMML